MQTAMMTSQAALPASHTFDNCLIFCASRSAINDTYDAAFERLRCEVCKVADLECLYALSYTGRSLKERDLHEGARRR